MGDGYSIKRLKWSLFSLPTVVVVALLVLEMIDQNDSVYQVAAKKSCAKLTHQRKRRKRKRDEHEE